MKRLSILAALFILASSGAQAATYNFLTSVVVAWKQPNGSYIYQVKVTGYDAFNNAVALQDSNVSQADMWWWNNQPANGANLACISSQYTQALKGAAIYAHKLGQDYLSANGVNGNRANAVHSGAQIASTTPLCVTVLSSPVPANPTPAPAPTPTPTATPMASCKAALSQLTYGTGATYAQIQNLGFGSAVPSSVFSYFASYGTTWWAQNEYDAFKVAMNAPATTILAIRPLQGGDSTYSSLSVWYQGSTVSTSAGSYTNYAKYTATPCGFAARIATPTGTSTVQFVTARVSSLYRNTYEVWATPSQPAPSGSISINGPGTGGNVSPTGGGNLGGVLTPSLCAIPAPCTAYQGSF